jgi:TolB-like protein/Flp pilus assembly protein TadD
MSQSSNGETENLESATRSSSGFGADARLFVSHSSHDAPLANRLVEDCERRGVRCWIAPRDVEPGALYAEEIIRGIDECQALALILSAHAVASSHVGKELERASSKRRRVMVVRVDSAPLNRAFEYFLSESQWIEFRGEDSNTAAARLVDALRHNRAPGDHFVRVPTSHSNAQPIKGLLVGLAAVVVLAVGYLAITRWVPSATPAKSVNSSVALAPSSASQSSIAVLPFLDMSQKKDQEYFSEGLSEELIDMLSRIPGLHVSARTSSFSFKGQPTTVAEIARTLGVEYVLEGSVRQSGDTLRITAQLIHAADGYHLWSQTFDHKFVDIFKMQDAIADAVVGALKVSLQSPASVYTGTHNAEAYSLFLQARYLSRISSGAPDTQRAMELLDKATALDPNFALAWGLKSLVFDDLQRPKDAKLAIQHALTLDPDDADVHTLMARVAIIDEIDIAGAEAHLRRSLELRPGNPFALSWMGSVSMYRGRFEQARDIINQAIARDPANSARYRDLSSVYFFWARYDDFRIAWTRMLELNPHASSTHWWNAQLLLVTGKPAEALAELDREPDADQRLICGCRVLMFDALNRKAEADASLADLEQHHADTAAYDIATVYANRGNSDKAFAWFDRAYQNHEGNMCYLKIDPLLKHVRDDARYRPLLTKLHLD